MRVGPNDGAVIWEAMILFGWKSISKNNREAMILFGWESIWNNNREWIE